MLAGLGLLQEFLYNNLLYRSKDVDLRVIPKAFMIYSITSIISLVLSGF